MTTHQSHVVVSQCFRQVPALLDIRDQKVGVAKAIRNIPHGHMGTDKAARMDDRSQRRAIGNPERQNIFGVRVYDRHDVRTRFENAAMNESLEIQVAGLIVNRVTIEIEFDNIVGRNQFWRE